MNASSKQIGMVGLLMVGVCLLIFLVQPVNADQVDDAKKIDAALVDELTRLRRTDFLVHFTGQMDLSMAAQLDWQARGEYVYNGLLRIASIDQAPAREILETRGISYRSFSAGNAILVRSGDRTLADQLAALPEVFRLEQLKQISIVDRLGSPFSEQVSAPGNWWELWSSSIMEPATEMHLDALTWGIVDAKADQFWSTFGLQGEGIVVANIDTGVQWEHPALDQAYRCSADPGNPACWFDPTGACPNAPCDDNGHGTFTMGVMVADDDPTLPYQAGMAPGAQWIACKACSAVGGCSTADLLACADWMLAPGGDPANRPHVVYNPWGGFQPCDPWFMTPVQAWVASGIFPIFPAGGQGPSCGTIRSPADYPNVFTTTAHDIQRLIASFAARGPSLCNPELTKPNICAPGVNICSSVPTDSWDCWSGTSTAGSHSGGAVALLWSCNPLLVGDVDGTFNALQLTADPPPDGNCGAPPSGNGNYTYGYGYLNILAAGLQYCSNISSLQGTVRNALTQVPVPDAQVQSELPGGFTWEVMSAQDGTYSLTLPVGVYTVTVDAMGYTHWITTGIEISLSQVYTLNPALVPQGWLTGIVTDAISGAPLDAWVSANGLMTFTQPGTGFYRLDLDAGIYTVQAGADGYSTTQKTASITAGEAMSLDFALLPLVIPRPPLAMFESNTPVCLGKTMVFTNTTNPGVPVTVTYGWDFGDGLTSTLEHPVHDYNAAGNYLVTLDACNATGCDTNEDQVEVIALPEAGFVFVTNGLTVTFTNTSMAATNFLWDFGDGEISSEINPTHTFDRPGIYSVWLGASSGCGLSFDHADLMVMPVADLGIQLVEWPDPVDVGGLLTYTLNISNSGPHVAIEVSAKLSPTVELAFVSVDGGGGICSFKEGVVSCTLDQLAPMEDWTMIVVVQAPSYPTSLTSVASLGAQVFDSNPENDLDTLITRVVWRGWYYIPLILKE